LVRPVGGKRVKRVGDGDDPALERYAALSETARITFAVPALMMLEDSSQDLVLTIDRFDYPCSYAGVLLYLAPLIPEKFRRLHEDALLYADLADIMQ